MINIFKNIGNLLSNNKTPETYGEILAQSMGKKRNVSDSLSKDEKAIYEAYQKGDKIRLINQGISPHYKSDYKLQSPNITSGIRKDDGKLTQII